MVDRSTGEPTLPDGSSLDLAMILDVAMVTNLAHRALGTRLLGLERRGATLGIDAPATGLRTAGSPPVDPAVGGEWANGVVVSLLDHACAIAALMALDDAARFSGSVGLRVEYIRPSRSAVALRVRAHCHHCDDSVALVHAEVFQPDDPAAVVAVGRGTIAVNETSPGAAP